MSTRSFITRSPYGWGLTLPEGIPSIDMAGETTVITYSKQSRDPKVFRLSCVPKRYRHPLTVMDVFRPTQPALERNKAPRVLASARPVPHPADPS